MHNFRQNTRIYNVDRYYNLYICIYTHVASALYLRLISPVDIVFVIIVDIYNRLYN